MGRPLNWIVLHHSVSTTTTDMEMIRGWHKAKGWSDIGYHFVLHLDEHGHPQIETGRPLHRRGAHCRPRNGDSIGICVSGNYSTEEPGPILWGSALGLVARLCREHDIPAERVIGHREAPWATQCPGDLFDLDAFRARVAPLLDGGPETARQ